MAEGNTVPFVVCKVDERVTHAFLIFPKDGGMPT